MENKKDIALCKPGFVTVIAGPCSVQSQEQTDAVAKTIGLLGLSWIRGGAFKPRMSPHNFQGLGIKGLEILSNSAKSHGLNKISEVTVASQLPLMEKHIDAFQIGTRNMTNYELLKEVGKYASDTSRQVMLKRGMSATIEEWLSASEYVTLNNNCNLCLCERGIRTFENSTRFTLDISSVPVVHKLSNLPICVDVSHAAGSFDLVPSLAKAAVASGADAVMIEVDPRPEKALSDGPQQLNLELFKQLVSELKILAQSLGKQLR